MKKVFIVFAEDMSGRKVLGVYTKKKDARARLIEAEMLEEAEEYANVFLVKFEMGNPAEYLI